jgi:hypothetical protein
MAAKDTKSTRDEKDDEDDVEIVAVETKPKKADEDDEDDEEDEESDSDAAAGKKAKDDDDDREDERLSASQDDAEEDTAAHESRNRRRRLKRREMRKRAEERARRELAQLRSLTEQQAARLAALEGNTLASNEAAIDQHLNAAMNEVAQAEHIIGRAVEANNGADVTAAMRLRDAAIAKAQRLQAAKQNVAQAKQHVASPPANAATQSLAKEWVAANPWFDPKLGNEDSRIAKAIDDGLVRDGYDPSTEEYWEELTKRVAKRLNGGKTKRAVADDGGDDEGEDETPRRKSPPQGATREYVSSQRRKEVYVTPELKAAMIEANVWDDPVRRKRVLAEHARLKQQPSR